MWLAMKNNEMSLIIHLWITGLSNGLFSSSGTTISKWKKLQLSRFLLGLHLSSGCKAGTVEPISYLEYFTMGDLKLITPL